jgi:hypothetical protein
MAVFFDIATYNFVVMYLYLGGTWWLRIQGRNKAKMKIMVQIQKYVRPAAQLCSNQYTSVPRHFQYLLTAAADLFADI